MHSAMMKNYGILQEKQSDLSCSEQIKAFEQECDINEAIYNSQKRNRDKNLFNSRNDMSIISTHYISAFGKKDSSSNIFDGKTGSNFAMTGLTTPYKYSGKETKDNSFDNL